EFTAAKAQAMIAAQKRIEQIRQVLRGKRPAAGRATSTANLTGAINEAAEKVRAKEMEVQAAQRAVEELAGVGPIEGTAEQAAIDSAYEANEAQVREKQQRQQQLEQYQQELQHLQQQEQYLQGYRGLIEQTAKIEGPRRASAVEKKQFAQIAGVGTGQPQSIPFSGTPASRLQRAPDTELDSALRKIHGAQRALADVLEERYKELQNLYAQQERLRADPSADANVIANVERQASDTQNRIGQQRTRWEELVASEDRVAAEYNSSARVAKRQGPRGK
ncbi:MAG: hypothetical protein Q8P12_03535, partial [bacterium]|nr:hypothetical protein [bacterium]